MVVLKPLAVLLLEIGDLSAFVEERPARGRDVWVTLL